MQKLCKKPEENFEIGSWDFWLKFNLFFLSLQLWREFTRRKNSKSLLLRFCSLHFTPECIKHGPKGRTTIRKGAVPTIYYKDGKKIVVSCLQWHNKAICRPRANQKFAPLCMKFSALSLRFTYLSSSPVRPSDWALFS